MHVKHAQPDHEIEPLLAERWSPYKYEPRAVEPEKLQACLEAARWAASSYNEQPWRFIVARRGEAAEFDRMLQCLVEPNRQWAQHAGAVLLTACSRTFSRNGKPNRVAEHDVGLAMGNFSVQATALGLHVHQMAGILPDKARETYEIPAEFDPLTAAAVGYLGAAGDDELSRRDQSPRTRKPLSELVFAGKWQSTWTA